VPPLRSLSPGATTSEASPAPSPTVPPPTPVDGEPEKAQPLADAPAAGQGPLPDADPVSCPSATHQVTTSGELADALASVQPGDTIQLAPGRYVGRFVAQVSGTETEPVFLCGPQDAVLDGGDVEDGYVLHLYRASYWRLVGFTVTNGQKGVMADRTVGTVIQDLTVTDVGDEAIHLRDNSTDNVVLRNTIGVTGLRKEDYGEGVYIGTAVSNWCTYTQCHADRSDRNVIKDNTFQATSSEAIDIKEGTTGGVVIGNTFDGSALRGADSWVDVKGNSYLVKDNRGVDAPEDGFQTHDILPGWGDHNVFTGNDATVNGPGYAISSWQPGSNVVTCDNTFSNAGEGLSNISCSGG